MQRYFLKKFKVLNNWEVMSATKIRLLPEIAEIGDN